jgi:hypothetical protein
MKTLLTPCKLSLALLWAGIAGSAMALGIGPLAGGATVGAPLDVRIPVDAPQAEGDGCTAAQVFFGDARVASRDTTLQMERTAAGLSAHLTSAVPVSEPVVTIELRAGCNQPVTRRFVLLADPPVVGQPVTAPVVASALQPVAMAPALRMQAAPSLAAASPRLAASRKPAPARLRREPAEAVTPAQAFLRHTAELGAAADASRRAAAVALWQAINASPEDVLRASERLGQLEQEVRALRDASAQGAREIGRLQADLGAPARWPRLPVSALVPLAALAALAGAALWWRNRRPRVAETLPDWLPPSAIDTDLAFLGEEEMPVIEPPRPAPVARPPALADVAAAPAVPRPGMPEPLARIALLDETLQEAEFFASIGQPGEAVRVLADYLDHGRMVAPLAWLELMEALEAAREAGLDMADVNQVALWRSDFEHRFGFALEQAQAPSDGLEAHPVCTLRIAATWPGPASLELVEDCLFDPQRLGARPSLQAWRELLWLYRIAQELDRMRGAPSALELVGDGPEPLEQFIMPLRDAPHAHLLTADRLQAIDIADASRFGVDVDLGSAAADEAAMPIPTLELEPGDAQEHALAIDDAFDAAVAGELRR